jgi:hypothetical protein
MKRRAILTVVLSCLLASIFSVSVVADEFSFFSPIVGSNPNVPIAGVASGGAPWVVKRGFAVLTDDGRLRADVRGLILPNLGTAGPVTEVSASVVCGGTVAATSAAVPLTTAGDAEIRAKLQIPSPCFAPAVLIRVAGANGNTLPAPGPWIAATGIADTDKDHDHN